MNNIIIYEDKYEHKFRELIFKLAQHIENIDPLKRNLIQESYKVIYVDNLFKEVKENNGIIYLYVENDIVLGTIVGIIEEKSESKRTYYLGNIGEILELYVDENARGKHIGDKLVKKMEDYFLNNGCDEVRLTVFAPNVNAIGFYRKVGYSDRNIGMIKELKKLDN